jgi:hypothetical protein
MTTHGPYDTREQATADVKSLRDTVTNAPAWIQSRVPARYLAAIITARAGRLGEYDTAVVEHLAAESPEVLQVIASWIERAHEAGRRSASASPIAFGGGS